ncbi:MAG: DEAD/DEAH box helicase family protein [Lachnospiraceae bacterium]|nr:DEAD/DEAH box helicase family protein [Lachnospiraceae bacterium]
MNTIKLSYDQQSFQVKPSGDEIRWINNRIARSAKELDRDGLMRIITRIGSEGCTFSPATFKDGKRNKDNFEQQQLFALDFDNKDPKKKLTFDEVKERASQYELPILFSYDTMSSVDHDKFRVVFLNDVSVTDRRVAEAIQLAMGKMFPEADPSCYKDVSKLYFGGKEVLYYDDKLPEINIESIFRNYTYCMKVKYKDNHYREHIAKFSKETGIALTKKGLLDVTVTDHLPETDDPTEDDGANQCLKNGKNSPTAIICNQDDSNIKEDGEIFPNKYYLINFNSKSTRSSSVKTPDEKSKNHKEFRSGVLQDMNKCKLFHDFANGSRKLSHDELFGIATNLIQIETGKKYFMKKILEHPDLYADDVKNKKWEIDLSYMNDYYPESCDKYCPYREECKHCKNILKTVHVERGSMEKIAGYHEEFCSMEEMQDDVYDAISNAYYDNSKKYYVIKAMTGAGKSHSYLKLMQENADTRFIIAVPTNLLKNEIFEKAKSQGIAVKKTPSLEEIKDEIPDEIWEHIQKLYMRGQHRSVHPYIQKRLEKEEIRCLEKYIKKREKLKTWDGCVITTHRYLLSMDKERLDEFDSIIIDEDILFKSIISNQGEISISRLEKLKKTTANRQLKEKIRKLLKAAATQTCIEAEGFEWEEDESDKCKIPFDLPAFCRAEQFYLRRKEDEKNLKRDTLVFLKPADFPGEKYIMVSATADEEICGWYFGKENVDFYECKKAKYKGKLKQYCGKSMSRTCLANNPGMVERLRSRFDMASENVITFMNQGIGELHFGNTEGSNMLEGQDILVVGTPYHAEFLYKLAALSMGVEFDEDEKMTMQTIERNGYRFRFTTFQDEELIKVHLWMIESELEQAVGRARLLRNACIVQLFSNFPLSQAKMIRNFDFEEN